MIEIFVQAAEAYAPNRFMARAFALAASSSRFRGAA